MEILIHDFGDFGTLTKIAANTATKTNDSEVTDEADLPTQLDLKSQPGTKDSTDENI